MVPEYYKKDIELIKSHGFNVIAVSTMMCEHTFYFNTKKEAERAFDYFEKGKNSENKWLCSGWWYGIEEKEQNDQDYFKKFNKLPITYFI